MADVATGPVTLEQLLGLAPPSLSGPGHRQRQQQRSAVRSRSFCSFTAGEEVVEFFRAEERMNTRGGGDYDRQQHETSQRVGVQQRRRPAYEQQQQSSRRSTHSIGSAGSRIASQEYTNRRLVFTEYLTAHDVERGLQRGELVEGRLRVNQRNFEESFLDNPLGPHGDSGLMICGYKDRNRALHGDHVVVKVKPRDYWIVQENLYEKYKEENGLVASKATTASSDSQQQPSPSQLVGRVGQREEEEKVDEEEQERSMVYTRGKMARIFAKVERDENAGSLSDAANEAVVKLKLQRTDDCSFDHYHPIWGDAHAGIARRVASVTQASPSADSQHSSGGSRLRTLKMLSDYAGQRVPDSCLQKTAEVVGIRDEKHLRKAVGVLKIGAPKGAGTAMGPNGEGEQAAAAVRPRFAVFSPTDARMPRVLIPADRADHNIPAGFFDSPHDFSKFIFIARIKDWPDNQHMPQGKLQRNLGLAGEIEPETEGLLCQYGVDTKEFSALSLTTLPPDYNRWKIPEAELKKRRLFKYEETVLSIAVASTGGVEKAIHLKKLADDGALEVGVHVADVGYFVEEKSELDTWMGRRTTAVNLVHKVVPMAPRALMEQLCSFDGGVDRLAFSVVWRVDQTGSLTDEWIGRSVVNCSCRLTFSVAQSLMQDAAKDELSVELPNVFNGHDAGDVWEALKALSEVAERLRRCRIDRGAVELDSPQLAFSLDTETSLPIGCSLIYQVKESQRMVETLLTEANVAVARRIYEAFPQEALLCCQPPPNDKLLAEVVDLASRLGYPLDADSSKGLNKSLSDYICSPVEKTRAVGQALQQFCLRANRPAAYFCAGQVEDELRYEHYALKEPIEHAVKIAFLKYFNSYTNFTSPTSRYADLIVHRMLADAILGADDDKPMRKTTVSLNDMSVKATYCNDRNLASETVAQLSADMFFAVFVKECGPLQEKAIVISILDHSIDVLLLRFGVVKRIFCNRLALSESKYEAGPPPKLELTWIPPPSLHSKRKSDGGPKTELRERDVNLYVQAITICSLLDVRITGDKEPLKYTALIHPAGYDPNAAVVKHPEISAQDAGAAVSV